MIFRPTLPVLAASAAISLSFVTGGTVRAEPPTKVDSPTAATAGKETLAITENGKTQTIDANDRDVSITGSHNHITVSGKCHALTINGDGNTVTLDRVVTISTPGNHNEVTYAHAADGETAQVTNVGAGNEIHHAKGN